MDSFYVVSKNGNGPFYSVGDYVELLYEVYTPCANPSTAQCISCHEGRDGMLIEKGRLFVTIGDGQIHKYIEDVLSNRNMRHGSAIYFYLASRDAFEEVGADTRVGPNRSLCFKIEEVAFNSGI